VVDEEAYVETVGQLSSESMQKDESARRRVGIATRSDREPTSRLIER